MNIHASSSTITKRLSSLFSTHLYRQELRGREAGRREREREREREGKHVAPYRVFGGNIGAQREQLGYHTWQSVCTRVHEQSLSFHVPIAAVLRVDVHAGGDDGLQQHLDCCFLLSRYRQPNGSAARLVSVFEIGASLQHCGQTRRHAVAGKHQEEPVLVLVGDVDLRQVLRKRGLDRRPVLFKPTRSLVCATGCLNLLRTQVCVCVICNLSELM